MKILVQVIKKVTKILVQLPKNMSLGYALTYSFENELKIIIKDKKVLLFKLLQFSNYYFSAQDEISEKNKDISTSDQKKLQVPKTLFFGYVLTYGLENELKIIITE